MLSVYAYATYYNSLMHTGFRKRLYRDSSSMDGGTLHQLCNLINGRNIPATSKSDVNACEDFLSLIGIAHTIAATVETMGLESIPVVLSQTLPELQEATIHRIASEVVHKNVILHLLGESSCAAGHGSSIIHKNS